MDNSSTSVREPPRQRVRSSQAKTSAARGREVSGRLCLTWPVTAVPTQKRDFHARCPHHGGEADPQASESPNRRSPESPHLTCVERYHDPGGAVGLLPGPGSRATLETCRRERGNVHEDEQGSSINKSLEPLSSPPCCLYPGLLWRTISNSETCLHKHNKDDKRVS